MKVAYFHGGQDIRVEEAPDPIPGPGEVLVRVRAAGICGSDLHRYRGQDPWGSAPTGPRRAGHELAGTVAALGPGAADEGMEIGLPVAVEPMQLAGCGLCRVCRRGQTHLCRRRGMVGEKRWTSAGFAELDVARGAHVYPLPASLSCEVAALADVYACAIHAVHRAPVKSADTVVVIGSGPVGLALGQVALLSGARRTILVGRRRAPLELALRIGAADRVVDLSEADGLGEAVRELTEGEGADTVFEAIGGQGRELPSRAVEALTEGGTLCVLGAYMGDVSVPYREANDKEITVKWSNGYATWKGQQEFRMALEGLADQRFEAAPLVTHRYPLSAIAEAFRAADDKARSGAVKVMVEP